MKHFNTYPLTHLRRKMMAPVKRLEAADLCRHCDPKQFNFETTAELEDLTEFVGQPRAVAALEFGIGIRQTGYNIFALGPEGTGKLSFVTDLFKQEAQSKTTPSDWCYVNNFEYPYRPHAICLPPGMGNTFRDDFVLTLQRKCSAPSAPSHWTRSLSR